MPREEGARKPMSYRSRSLEGPSREEAARGRIVVAHVLRQPDGGLKAAPLPGALAERVGQAPSEMLSATQKIRL